MVPAWESTLHPSEWQPAASHSRCICLHGREGPEPLPLGGSLPGYHTLIEIAVAISLLALTAEPINLQELNQAAVLVKHYKNRVPRFSVQRSKNPFVFCRL